MRQENDSVLSVFFDSSVNPEHLSQKWGPRAKVIWDIGRAHRELQTLLASVLYGVQDDLSARKSKDNWVAASVPGLSFSGLRIICAEIELHLNRRFCSRLASIDRELRFLQSHSQLTLTEDYDFARSTAYVVSCLIPFRRQLQVATNIIKAIQMTCTAGLSTCEREIRCRDTLCRYATSGDAYQRCLCERLVLFWTQNALLHVYNGLVLSGCGKTSPTFHPDLSNSRVPWFIMRTSELITWEAQPSTFGCSRCSPAQWDPVSVLQFGHCLALHWDSYYSVDPDMFPNSFLSEKQCNQLLFTLKTLHLLTALGLVTARDKLVDIATASLCVDWEAQAHPASWESLPAQKRGRTDLLQLQTTVGEQISNLHSYTEQCWANCLLHIPFSLNAPFPSSLELWINFAASLCFCTQLDFYSQLIRISKHIMSDCPLAKGVASPSSWYTGWSSLHQAHRVWSQAVKTSFRKDAPEATKWLSCVLLHPLKPLLDRWEEKPPACRCSSRYSNPIALDGASSHIINVTPDESEEDGWSVAWELQTQPHWGDHHLATLLVLVVHVRPAADGRSSITVELFRPLKYPVSTNAMQPKTDSAKRCGCLLDGLSHSQNKGAPRFTLDQHYYVTGSHVEKCSRLSRFVIKHNPYPPSLSVAATDAGSTSEWNLFVYKIIEFGLIPTVPNASLSRSILHSYKCLSMQIEPASPAAASPNSVSCTRMYFPFIPIPVLPSALHIIFASLLPRCIRAFTQIFFPLLCLLEDIRHQMFLLARHVRQSGHEPGRSSHSRSSNLGTPLHTDPLPQYLYKMLHTIYSILNPLFTYFQHDVVQVELRKFSEDAKQTQREHEMENTLRNLMFRLFATIERRCFLEHPPLKDLMHRLFSTASCLIHHVATYSAQKRLLAEDNEELLWKIESFWNDARAFDKEIVILASVTHVKLSMEALHARIAAALHRYRSLTSKNTKSPSHNAIPTMEPLKPLSISGLLNQTSSSAQLQEASVTASIPTPVTHQQANLVPVRRQFELLTARLEKLQLKFNRLEENRRRNNGCVTVSVQQCQQPP